MYVYRRERDGKGKTDRHNEQNDIKKCPLECVHVVTFGSIA